MNPAAHRRKTNETRILEVRSMTTADLHLLRNSAAPTHTVKTLRERHHHMAFLVALGKTNLEVAAECRCSPARVAQHKGSPAFQDIVTKYRNEIETARIEKLKELGAIAAENMLDTELILRKEILAIKAGEAQTPGLSVLNKISTDRMDRFGYPKKTLSDTRTMHVDFAVKLEAAIARSTQPKVLTHD